ncbi:MAG: hypothetical protein ACK5JI_09965 [Azonexus sp.]
MIAAQARGFFGLDKSAMSFYDVRLFAPGWQAMFNEKRISRDRRVSGVDARAAGEVVERRRRRRRQMSIREISFTEWARYFALYKRRK